MMDTPRILVLNGPNLQKIGTREVEIYGSLTLDGIAKKLTSDFQDVMIEFVQSDLEGMLIQGIHRAEENALGVVLNAGGYTHTSVALRDAISAVSIPVIEVHISNVLAREPFRHDSLIGGVCAGTILGFGADSYNLAITQLLKRFS